MAPKEPEAPPESGEGRAERLLTSRDTLDRARALRLLERRDIPSRQALLLRALKDRSNYIAAAAAQILADCAEEPSLSAMRERFCFLAQDGLKRDPGCHIRSHLAIAFGRLAYTPAIADLREGLQTVQIEPVAGIPTDTAVHLRANCALALGALHDFNAIRDVAVLLFTPSDNLDCAKAAVRSLAMMGHESCLIPLHLALCGIGTMPAELLEECMAADVELEDPRAVEVLTPFLHGSNPGLAAFAAIMVARTRAPEAADILLEAIDRFRAENLEAVALAVCAMRTEGSVKAAAEMLQSARSDVRLAVLAAMAETGPVVETSVLQKMVGEDPDREVRKAAAQLC
ncbi:MAG TPA: HEAT repeat domain-containing protein [Chthonomonadales bacterium]|nr:HEAT repeat domain-containing protein [Chthonomonadales bacterium]